MPEPKKNGILYNKQIKSIYKNKKKKNNSDLP